MASPPLVVAVSGTSGAGKSTLVRSLAQAWRSRGTVVVELLFDDFAPPPGRPEDVSAEHDLGAWLAGGGDPNEWRTDRMGEELRRLVSAPPAGTSLEDNRVALVIVEEPFGRARDSVGSMVDLGLHIDLSLNVALARRLTRQFVPSAGGIDPSVTAQLRRYLLAYLADGAAAYQVIDALAAGTADVVLDGLRPPAELLERAVGHVAARLAGR